MVWALAAASAVHWGLKLFVKAPAVPLHAKWAETGGAAQGDLTRLLGADPVAAPEAAPVQAAPDPRFQLIGVLSPPEAAAAREGLALIAIDGKPAKAYRVGATVDGDTVLQAVQARGATLGPRGGPALVSLNIAPPNPAATGTLPPATSGASPAQPPVMRPGLPTALPAGAAAPPQPLRPMPLPIAPALGGQPLSQGEGRGMAPNTALTQ